MKETIQKMCDVLTIVCPAIIAVVGTLEASGVIELFGARAAAVAAVLAGITAAASVTFNFVTGYYKQPKE